VVGRRVQKMTEHFFFLDGAGVVLEHEKERQLGV
jgi:hypothetical protein